MLACRVLDINELNKKNGGGKYYCFLDFLCLTLQQI